MNLQRKKDLLHDLINSSFEYMFKIIQFEKTRIYDYLSNRRKIKYKIFLSLRIIFFLMLCIITLVDFNIDFFYLLIPILLILSLLFTNIGIRSVLENDKYVYIKRELRKITEINIGIQLVINNRDLLNHYNIAFDNKSQIVEITQEEENLNQIIKSNLLKFIESKGTELLTLFVTIFIFMVQIDNIVNYDILIDALFLGFIFVSYFILDDYFAPSEQDVDDLNKSFKKLIKQKLIDRLNHNLSFFRNLLDNLNIYPSNEKNIDILYEEFNEKRIKVEEEDKTLFKYFY